MKITQMILMTGAVCVLFACSEETPTGPSGDCSMAGQSCADGFSCLEQDDGSFRCRPDNTGQGGDAGSGGEAGAGGADDVTETFWLFKSF